MILVHCDSMCRRAIARSRGFTLVELIVTLVIVGFLAYALFKAFRETLPRTPTPAQVTQAVQLAQARMELILGQRAVAGYGGMADPTPGCQSVSGFGVNATIANNWPVDTVNFKQIVVTAYSSPSCSGQPLAQLTAVVGNY